MVKTFIRARWLLVGLLGFGLWLTPGASYGQSRELEEAFNRARTLYGQGRFQKALPVHKTRPSNGAALRFDLICAILDRW